MPHRTELKAELAAVDLPLMHINDLPTATSDVTPLNELVNESGGGYSTPCKVSTRRLQPPLSRCSASQMPCQVPSASLWRALSGATLFHRPQRSAHRPSLTGSVREGPPMTAALMCAGMSSSPSSVCCQGASRPSGTARRAHDSKSARTSGSAFSFSTREADVCWRKTCKSPQLAAASGDGERAAASGRRR